MKWADADRISDRIVAVLNDERVRSGPMAMFAGTLLALKAIERTMPERSRPDALNGLLEALDRCLASIAMAYPLKRRSR